MICAESKIRVRYAETDQMGFVYYGVYAQYYEIGRVDAIRKLGFSYRNLEARGLWLPVLHFEIKYIKPARYDEELLLHTYLKQFTEGPRIVFECEMFNSDREQLNKGRVELVCIGSKNLKPQKFPNWFTEALRPHFKL